MQPNAAGQHVKHLEIYAPDVLADDTEEELRDGAAQFKSRGRACGSSGIALRP